MSDQIIHNGHCSSEAVVALGIAFLGICLLFEILQGAVDRIIHMVESS